MLIGSTDDIGDGKVQFCLIAELSRLFTIYYYESSWSVWFCWQKKMWF